MLGFVKTIDKIDVRVDDILTATSTLPIRLTSAVDVVVDFRLKSALLPINEKLKSIDNALANLTSSQTSILQSIFGINTDQAAQFNDILTALAAVKASADKLLELALGSSEPPPSPSPATYFSLDITYPDGSVQTFNDPHPPQEKYMGIQNLNTTVLVTLTPRDEFGNLAKLDGKFDLQLQGSLATLSDISEDGLSAKITTGKVAGQYTLSGTGDADLGEGVTPIVLNTLVTIPAGNAVTIDVVFGAEEPASPAPSQPASGSGDQPPSDGQPTT